MAPEVRRKVWAPFYRADRVSPSGKGMGLSIVRRLGERFRWPVKLDSAPGAGTVASIEFARDVIAGASRAAVEPPGWRPGHLSTHHPPPRSFSSPSPSYFLLASCMAFVCLFFFLLFFFFSFFFIFFF